MSPAIGIGIGIPFKGGISWAAYWATRDDLLLFFGEKSKVTGGKLYNQVDGSSDYLDVAGVAGSETFKIPDSYGAEKIDNNTFDDAAWWSNGGVTIIGGVVEYLNKTTTDGIYKAAIFEIGKTYKISYEIKDYVSGSISIYDFTGRGVTRSGNGVFTELYKALNTYIGLFPTVAGTTLNIDNFYCQEILPYTDYVAADTDYLWYADDALQNRLVTTDELQRYDWARTIIKYGDVSPYTIEWIAILKDGVVLTTAEENSLRDSFHLSIWWSGVLSAHGNLKGNRIAEKSDGTELVVGGEFTLAGWTVDAGVQAFGGACYSDLAAAGGVRRVLGADPFVVGETYRVIYEITNFVSGTVRFKIAWSVTMGTYRSADGIYIEDVVYVLGTDPARIDLYAGVGGFVGTIDHFSIRRL